MKKFIIILLSISFVTMFIEPNIASASNFSPQREIIYLENGDYLETVIKDVPTFNSFSIQASNTITKTKITRYKNESGTTLWSISITATFTYDGSSSQCTACSPAASAPATTWSIKSVSSSKSGNKATTVATATHSNGNLSQDITKSVTIQCSKTGVVS